MAEEYDFHLRVFHDGTEKSKEEYRQWKKGFEFIEKKAKGLNLDYSFTTSFDMNNDVLSIFVTGKDLFLGIRDVNNNTLMQEANFEDIKYTSANIMQALEKRITLAFAGFTQEKNDEMLKVWPRQVAKIRAYEYKLGINQKPDIPSRKIEIPHIKI